MGAKILTLSLPQQSCSLHDKSLTGHNIICQTKLVFEVSQLLEFFWINNNKNRLNPVIPKIKRHNTVGAMAQSAR
jgi:hypothetical protein